MGGINDTQKQFLTTIRNNLDRMTTIVSDLNDITRIETGRLKLDIRPFDFQAVVDEVLHGTRSLIEAKAQTLKVERGEDSSFVASVEEVPLKHHVQTTSGSIDSSLWVAGVTAGLRHRTTSELTEIFKWDIDFFSVQSGDSFKVVYEQLERDGEIVDDGNILAAEFISGGKTFRAVRYEMADGKFGFLFAVVDTE